MPLTTDRATEILLEETLAGRGNSSTPDRDPEEAEYRNRIRKEVSALSDPAEELHGITERVASLRCEEIREAISRLCEGDGERYLELGGVLSRVVAEDWFLELGYPSFRRWLSAETKLKHAKARYLIQIYDELVERGLPFGMFKGVGWTKMKVLLPVIRSEKVDDWVEAAKHLTRESLEAAVKAASGAAERLDQPRGPVQQRAGAGIPTPGLSSLEEAAQLLRNTYSWLKLNTGSPYEATVIIVEAFESVISRDEAEILTKAEDSPW